MPDEGIFVGQQRGLQELSNCLARVSANQSHIILVTGGAGAGKTQLVKEFLARSLAEDQDILVGQGTCYAYTEKVGYFPFQRAFEDLLSAQKTTQLLNHVINKVAKFTWSFAPELVGMFLPPASPLLKRLEEIIEESFGLEVGEAERLANPWEGKLADPYSIWEHFSQLLTALAADAPVLIFLDDLHWADQETLGLLTFLGQNLAGRVLLIGTYRPYEVNRGRDGDEHPLQRVRRDLLQAHRLREITVSPLPVREYINQKYKVNSFTQDLFNFLRIRTEGNAFFLTELLEEMERENTLQYIDGCWQLVTTLRDDLPTSIEAVLEGRLNASRTGDEAHSTLITASVEGYIFTAQVLAQVQGLTEMETTRLLTERLDRCHHLVCFDREENVPNGILDHYSFRHVLFQDYLYRRLGRAQRRLLHARVGETLEKLYAGVETKITLELARHFREAQDWIRLGKYALAAAKQQAKTYSFKETKIWCQEGCLAINKLPSTDENRLIAAELLLELGQAEASLTGNDAAISQYRQAEQILIEIGDKALLAKTYFLLGKALYEAKRWEEALEYLFQSLELRDYLQAGESCAEVLTTIRFIFKRTPDREYDDFFKLCKKLIAMSAQRDNSLANIDILEAMGYVYDDMGFVELAIKSWTHALQIAKESNDKVRETRVLRRVGRGLRQQRRFEDALVHYVQSRDLATGLGRPRMEISALDGMALTYRQMGKLEKALQCRQEQLEIARRIGYIPAVATALRTLGFGLSKLGRKEEAERYYREDFELCLEYGLVHGSEKARNNLAAILKHRGQFTEALDIFSELLEAGKCMNDLGRISITLNHIGDIYRIQGKAQRALECHKQALEILSSKEYQNYLIETHEAMSEDDGGRYIDRQALTLRYLSVAHLELGELNEALRCCTKSVDIYASRGRIDGEGNSLTQMGLVVLASGDIKTAIEILSRARDMLETVNPESVGNVMNALALAHLAEGDRRKALTTAWAAVQALEKIDLYSLGDARLTLAKAHLQAGDREKAVKWVDLAREKFMEMGLEHRLKEADLFRQELASV